MTLGKATPVQVPGFAGSWALPTAHLPLLFGAFDATGSYTIQLPLASAGSAAGIPTYWQGIQVSGTAGSFGQLEVFGIYL